MFQSEALVYFSAGTPRAQIPAVYCIQFESETNRSRLLLSEHQQLFPLLNLHRQEVSSAPEGNH